jgi:hypothetical protein
MGGNEGALFLRRKRLFEFCCFGIWFCLFCIVCFYECLYFSCLRRVMSRRKSCPEHCWHVLRAMERGWTENQRDQRHSTRLDKKRRVSLLYNVHFSLSSTFHLSGASVICLLASSIVIISSFRVSLLPLCHMAQMSARLFSSLLSPSTTIRKSLTPPPLTHHPSRLFLIIIPAQFPRSILITPVSVLSHAPKNWKCPGYCFNTVICGTLHYHLHYTIIIITLHHNYYTKDKRLTAKSARFAISFLLRSVLYLLYSLLWFDFACLEGKVEG